MALEETGVKLVADSIDSFLADMKKATAAVENFARDGQKAASGTSAFGQVITGALREVGAIATRAMAEAGKAVAAFAVDSIKAAGDFEGGMNRFAAVTGSALADSGQSLDDFKQLFLELGAETQYSAAQAQEAAINLAKGGLTPAAIAGGDLANTLTLAAAGELDLALAAEITAKQLGVWSSEGVTSAQVANQLAQAANASTVDVDELAVGLANVGGVAKVAGLSFTETTQTMALLAPGFSSASDAGTSFKAFLNNLIPTTSDATGMMTQLGLYTAETGSKFYDATGSFIGMEEASRLLQDATAGLTEEQTSLALEIIFGADAQRAAALIAEKGAEGYLAMGVAMDAAGTAADQAAARNIGFNFALESLSGSLDTLKIVLGTAILPLLTDLVENILIPGVNAALGLAQGTMDLDTAMRELGAGINDMLPGTSSLIELAADGELSTGGWARANKAAADIFGDDLAPAVLDALKAVGDFRVQVEDAWPGVSSLVELFKEGEVSTGGWARITKLLTAVLGEDLGTAVADALTYLDDAKQTASDLADSWSENFERIQKATEKVMGAVWEVVSSIGKQVADFWSENGDDILDFVQRAWDKVAEIIESAAGIIAIILKKIAGWIDTHGEDIQRFLSRAWDTIDLVITTTLNTISGTLKTILALMEGDWEKAWAHIKDTSAKFVLGISGIVLGFLETIAAANGTTVDDISQTWADSLKQTAKDADDFLHGIADTIEQAMMYLHDNFVEGLQGIETDWNNFVRAAERFGRDLINGIIGGIEDAAGDLADAASNAADAALEAAKRTIQAKSPSRRAADEVGRPIAEGMAVGIQEGRPIAESAAAELSGGVLGILEADALTVDDIMADAMAGYTQAMTDAQPGAEAAAQATTGITLAPFEPMPSHMSNLISGAVNSIKDGFEGSFADVQLAAGGVANAALLGLSNVVPAAGIIANDTIGNILGTLQGAQTPIGEAAAGLADAVLDPLGIIGPEGESIVDGAMAGIGQGITDSVAEITRRAMAAAQAAVDSIAAALDIHSPSGVTAAEIGVPFIDGIISGMQSRVADLVGAVRNIGAAMTKAGADAVADTDKLFGDIGKRMEGAALGGNITIGRQKLQNADAMEKLRAGGQGRIEALQEQQQALGPGGPDVLRQQIELRAAAIRRQHQAEVNLQESIGAEQLAFVAKLTAVDRKRAEEQLKLDKDLADARADFQKAQAQAAKKAAAERTSVDEQLTDAEKDMQAELAAIAAKRVTDIAAIEKEHADDAAARNATLVKEQAAADLAIAKTAEKFGDRRTAIEKRRAAVNMQESDAFLSAEDRFNERAATNAERRTKMEQDLAAEATKAETDRLSRIAAIRERYAADQIRMQEEIVKAEAEAQVKEIERARKYDDLQRQIQAERQRAYDDERKATRIQEQLAQAEAEALKISQIDAQKGADYYRLRSAQITEMIGLEEEARRLQAGISMGAAGHPGGFSAGEAADARTSLASLQQRIALVKQAQQDEAALFSFGLGGAIDSNRQQLAESLARLREASAKETERAAKNEAEIVAINRRAMEGEGALTVEEANRIAMLEAERAVTETTQRTFAAQIARIVSALQTGATSVEQILSQLTGGSVIRPILASDIAAGTMYNSTTTAPSYNLSVNSQQSSQGIIRDFEIMKALAL